MPRALDVVCVLWAKNWQSVASPVGVDGASSGQLGEGMSPEYSGEGRLTQGMALWGQSASVAGPVSEGRGSHDAAVGADDLSQQES